MCDLGNPFKEPQTVCFKMLTEMGNVEIKKRRHCMSNLWKLFPTYCATSIVVAPKHINFCPNGNVTRAKGGRRYCWGDQFLKEI